MTASETIKRFILDKIDSTLPIEKYYDFDVEDEQNDFRCSGVPTGLPAPYNRYYESSSVARKIGETWVGWTYFFGGGKHGEPSAVEWIEDAYLVKIFTRL